MSASTGIEWTDATWPVVQGCAYESAGCTNCYAVPLIWRLAHNPLPAIAGGLQGLVRKQRGKLVWSGKVALREDRLGWPAKWRTPRRIFVPSHGDLFHDAVPDDFIAKVFAVMAATPQHTYQLLTKRAERMRDYCTAHVPHPLANVWLGVSAEDQVRADERIPPLLATPAARRFVSLEPLLGRISLNYLSTFDGPVIDALAGEHWYQGPRLDWVIVGGESGPGARPLHPAWIEDLLDACQRHAVAFFFKQWGAWAPIAPQPDGTFGGDLVSDTIRAIRSDGSQPQGRFQPGDVLMARAATSANGATIRGRAWREFPT